MPLMMLCQIVGNQSLVRELCMSGRKLKAAEALSLGFVSRVKILFPLLLGLFLSLSDPVSRSPSRLLLITPSHSLTLTLSHTLPLTLPLHLTPFV